MGLRGGIFLAVWGGDKQSPLGLTDHQAGEGPLSVRVQQFGAPPVNIPSPRARELSYEVLAGGRHAH